MYKWYVVQVLSGQEKKTKKLIEEMRDQQGLKEQIPEILLPTEKISEVKAGQQRISERRIWPGYLLLRMLLSDESWQFVKGVSGVIDFLGGGSPTALTEVEVDQVLSDLAEKKETVTLKHKFEVGGHVKITDGVFVNFMGTITGVSHEKGTLNVRVSIFGRDTQVDDLEFWQVEEVSDEEMEQQ